MARRHEKLIRDRIPEIAAREGRVLQTRRAEPEEMELLLARKLVEESAEVRTAWANGDTADLINELADLQFLIEEIAGRAGIDPRVVTEAVQARRLARGGFSAGLVLSEDRPRPIRLHSGRGGSLIEALRRELSHCQVASLAVSFVMSSGLDLLEGAMRAALLRGATIRLLTTDYLDVSEPLALRRLLAMPGNLDVRVFSDPAHGFHPKAYLFQNDAGSGRAFVGSANLSRSGLFGSVEWTWTIEATDLGHPLDELAGQFSSLFESPHSSVLSPGWIDEYETRWSARRAEQDSPTSTTGDEPQPRPAQLVALDAIAKLREAGERRALVVAATGIGKTWLAAFDSRKFENVLFIAHREELLIQARDAFSRVFPGRTVGVVVAGDASQLDRDMVFASIQTLARPTDSLNSLLAKFKYVVIDEFHHAAAPSYLGVLEKLSPDFLLGLTATPYRGDNRDLLALCDGNIAYELRLFEAIAMGWLAPFRYYGVADTVDYDSALLNATRTGYDPTKLQNRYDDKSRTQLVIRLFREHCGRAALGFCISIAHAEAMASAFIEVGIAALAVHSGTAREGRAAAISSLESGELRILFVVDLFNEGVDIPVVDLVMFLRPTESMTVFLQQLGRGLRLCPGKDRLTVVDLIGNHRKAQFKLPFLVGLEDDGMEAPVKALPALRNLLRTGSFEALPAGLEIHLEELALENLEKALRDGAGQKSLLIDAYAEIRQSLGRRPTMSELEIRGRYSPTQYLKAFGSWFSALRALDDVKEEELELEDVCGDFLREVEKTSLTKSYKLVALRAMLARDEFSGESSLDSILSYFRTHFSDDRYSFDIRDTQIENVQNVVRDVLADYVVRNPINAWIGGNTKQASQYFTYDGDREVFRYIGPRPSSSQSLATALKERVDYLLLKYQQRRVAKERLYRVIPTAAGVCIMLGPEAADGLPRNGGWQVVRIGEKFLYAKFAKIAINVIANSAQEGSPNLIGEVLKELFDDQSLLEFRRSFKLRIYRSLEDGVLHFEPIA